MIARLKIVLPFEVDIPENEKFKSFSYVDSGYQITLNPPLERKSADSEREPLEEELRINGIKAIKADLLQIDFKKDDFNRSDELIKSPELKIDPPAYLIKNTISSLLLKLRFVIQAPKVRIFDFPWGIDWEINYLNDDGTELEKTQGLLRKRWLDRHQINSAVVNRDVWGDMCGLSLEFSPPKWNALFLDAFAAIPNLGSSIVLCYAALEIFINELLEKLVKASPIPPPLWNWINNRGNFIKDASTDEQFDILLKVLSGYSMKEDDKLWQIYKKIKKARHSFIHEGEIHLSELELISLLNGAKIIFSTIKSKIPQEMQWVEYQYSLSLESTKQLRNL